MSILSSPGPEPDANLVSSPPRTFTAQLPPTASATSSPLHSVASGRDHILATNKENVHHFPGFGSGESCFQDTHDLVDARAGQIIGHPERSPDDGGILGKVPGPIIVGQDRDRMGAGLQVVSLREQAACCGMESETAKRVCAAGCPVRM